jgi:hypothetical protein
LKKKTNIPLEQQQSTSVFPLPMIQTAIAHDDGQSQRLMPITRSASIQVQGARSCWLDHEIFLPARQHDGQLTVVLSLRQSEKNLESTNYQSDRSTPAHVKQLATKWMNPKRIGLDFIPGLTGNKRVVWRSNSSTGAMPSN